MLKAPAQQNATDTISTLSSRLASATLLEDRRASIQGLRSFAKQYPASVASGSLRGLIGCLRSDGMGLGKEGGEGDVDTVRLILETLLMLFNPDEASPEASEDIALWLADEFSQRQDNITILLDLLDTPDYYARIYSIELLTAISASRPERTQECILLAPLGVPRLVSVLDDSRDAVRNAALLLLVDLTNVSQTELQKIIAFEDAFQRIFKLIQLEGGLSEGGIVVQDCLSLLANLIRHSASNQTLFRETGCIPRLVELVKQVAGSPQDENAYSRTNREKNAWGLLTVVRLFLEKGEVGTKPNQDAFWKSGMVHVVLNLAFDSSAGPPIRTNALRTCADTISSNHPLQQDFAGLVVQISQPQTNPPTVNGARRSKDARRVYVIEALLGLVLASSETVEIRSAACGLIKAYFTGHELIKHHFLQRAIAGYKEGEDETTNVLSTLITGPQSSVINDASRYMFAGGIVSQLIFDQPEAKALLMGVSEGDAEKGEDVITAIQMMSGHLLSTLQGDLDPHISIAYLNLLIIFLFDSPAAINDCLAEGSALLGALIATASTSTKSQVASDPVKSLLPGLCATLLGTIYEFSTKDSPIPRRTLQPFLVSRLGRQRYFDALLQLRQHPTVRDAEIDAVVGASDLLFDPKFVEWFKDEYGRLRRAVDKDPGIEVVQRGMADGVDRDILDSLREQIQGKEQQLEQREMEMADLRQKADQSDAEHRREMQELQSRQRTLEGEVERRGRINEALQRDHDAELSNKNAEIEKLRASHQNTIQSVQQQSEKEKERLRAQHEQELERTKGQHAAQLASERSLAEDRARKATDQRTREHQTALQELQAAIQEHKDRLEAKEKSESALQQSLRATKSDLDKRSDELREAQSSLKETQEKLADKERSERVLRQEHQSTTATLDKLRDEHQKLKDKLTRTDQDLQRTRGIQNDLQQVNTKALARVKTLEEEAKARNERVSGLQEERERLEKEKTELENKLKGVGEEVEGLKLELEAERKGYGELEAELSEVKAELGKASEAQPAVPGDEDSKKEAAEAKEETEKMRKMAEQTRKEADEAKGEAEKEKEEAKKARGELEDMLMVMSDLEAKRDEYRERLKKLGGEVTEDEDEDDEEDEEEDQEE